MRQGFEKALKYIVLDEHEGGAQVANLDA